MMIDVVCLADNGGASVAARLAVDHLDIGRANLAGQDIFEICDSDSGGWESVFAAVFAPGGQGEWFGDLEFDEPVNHLLFLHKAVFHPCLRTWRKFTLDHVASLCGEDSAIVMWRGESGLTDKELAELGFRNIAGSAMLVRPNMLQHSYNANQDPRDVLDLNVPPDANQYVELHWETGRR